MKEQVKLSSVERGSQGETPWKNRELVLMAF